MKNILAAFTLLFSLSTFAQEKGIQFEHNKTFAELKTMAKEQNKLIFMDCYTTWCGPCKYLSAKIFTLPEVGAFYNKNFINCKFDMEKGEGIDIGKEFAVRAYPTLLFINGDGELEHKKIGGGTADDILNLGKSALDKENNFKAVSERIKNKSFSSEDIKNYLSYNKYGKDNGEVLNLFFKGLNSESYYTEETWEVIETHLNDIESDFGKFFLENREKYNATIGKKNVDGKIQQLIAQGIQKARGDEAIIAKYKAIDPELAESIVLQMELNSAYGKLRRASDDEALIKAFADASDKYLKSDFVEAGFLNRFAWDIYKQFINEKMSKPSILETGLKLSSKMIELAPKDPALLDTHAHLLFVSKDVKNAIAMQEKAIAILKKKGDLTEQYEKALQKMRESL